MHSLKQELDNILSGQRKHLCLDSKLITKSNTSQSPQDIARRNCRAIDRFATLVNCLSDVTKFVDWFWGYYHGEKKSQEEKALLDENEKLKEKIKKQAEEITKLQELAISRKKKLQNWLLVMRRLNEKINILNKRELARKYLSKT
jgi:hypothetical protein